MNSGKTHLRTMCSLAIAGLVLSMLGCGDDGAERRKPVYRSDKVQNTEESGGGASDDSMYGPDGGKINMDVAGSIKGSIKFTGAAPAPANWDLGTKDQFCTKNATVPKEELLVGAGGELKDMFVYIEKGLDGKDYPKPDKTVRIVQENCMYVPHVVGLRAGVDFEVENKDNTNHNYHFIGRKNAEINESQSGPKVDTKVLRKPEIGAQMKCDVHPWMLVNIHVLDHGCFAVTDAAGNFEIKGVPPGKYRLSFKHERSSVKIDSMDITIGAKETKDLGALSTKS